MNMEYTGNYIEMYSKDLDRVVAILEYKSNDNTPYIECSRCGKPIRRKMYVIQDSNTDLEIAYLGSECIKHFQ